METYRVLVLFFNLAVAFSAPSEDSIDLTIDMFAVSHPTNDSTGIELVVDNERIVVMQEEDTVEQKSEDQLRLNDDCVRGGPVLKCHNDTAVRVCTPSGKKIIPCHGMTPHCNANLNVCVSGRAEAVGGVPSNGFTCPQEDGYYPDFSSCRKYYFCANGKPTAYECDWTDVYDPKIRSCVRHLPGNPCHRFQCIGKQGRFTPYSGEPNIYTICSGNQPLVLFRCPLMHAMNERKQNCELHCEKEGLMKNMNNCQKYYECTRTLLGYRIREGQCPPGAWFNPKTKQCAMLTEMDDCPEALPMDVNNNMEDSSTEDVTGNTTNEP